MKKGLDIIKIGTRGSALALAQTEEVKKVIISKFPGFSNQDIEVVPITTTGDRIQDRPLAEIGGKSLFTKEIEEALACGRIDIAVHSLKDMPPFLPDGLIIGAVLEREDPRDALICEGYDSILKLPAGAVLGTSSVRRAAQVSAIRPDIKIAPLRGNVTTRLAKLRSESGIDATILAVAGLKRLGIGKAEYKPIEVSSMVPAVAQGAIGIECREGDDEILEILAGINHEPTNICTAAERVFLGVLEGSCKTPIAALAEITGGKISLSCLISSLDGKSIYRYAEKAAISDAVKIGLAAGNELKVKAKQIF